MEITNVNAFLDKRVKAAFAIAPALGGGFTAENLKPIKIPVEIVVVASDTQAPAKTNADVFNRSIKKSKLTILPGDVAHYVFFERMRRDGKSRASRNLSRRENS